MISRATSIVVSFRDETAASSIFSPLAWASGPLRRRVALLPLVTAHVLLASKASPISTARYVNVMVSRAILGHLTVNQLHRNYVIAH